MTTLRKLHPNSRYSRIEITSVGFLPEGLSEIEFFEGFSVPRNKELMRIFKDLDLVEQLGLGIARILKSYGKECFLFSDKFLRMVGPVHSNEQATEQVETLIEAMNSEEYSRAQIMELVGVKHRHTFLYNYLQPAIALGFIELTFPDKPNSSKQKYKPTESLTKFTDALLETIFIVRPEKKGLYSHLKKINLEIRISLPRWYNGVPILYFESKPGTSRFQ